MDALDSARQSLLHFEIKPFIFKRGPFIKHAVRWPDFDFDVWLWFKDEEDVDSKFKLGVTGKLDGHYTHWETVVNKKVTSASA